MNFNLKRKCSNHSRGKVSFKNENTNNIFCKSLKRFSKYKFYPNSKLGSQTLLNFLKIEEKNFIIGFGSECLLRKLFFLLDYDSIQILEHSYEMAFYYNELLSKKIIINELSFVDNNFNHSDIFKLGGDLLYLVNPHCPTGITFDLKAIRAFAAKFKYVIVDEAYTNPLRHEWPFFENVIFVKTFSKLGGVPGLRLGYAVGPESIIQKLQCVKDCYEITQDAVNYIKFICKQSKLIEDNINEMEKCYRLLKNKQKCFSKKCANFATFESGNFIGKQYKIGNKTFTRVTLTDSTDYENLYCR
jgi:histidinol-phosphate/aromatic aminotransferase/cobyric acid decarboxylase-like protein